MKLLASLRSIVSSLFRRPHIEDEWKSGFDRISKIAPTISRGGGLLRADAPCHAR